MSAAIIRSRGAAAARGVIAIALLLAVLPPGLPALAGGGTGTIVFIRDGQVWAMDGSGTRQHHVTAGLPGTWADPSMTDDGTIVAINRDGDPIGDLIVRLSQSGQVLSAFNPERLFISGISELEVSRDGRLAVYTTVEPCSSGGRIETCSFVGIVDADGSDPSPRGGVVNENYVTWMPGTDTVVATNRTPHYFTAGDEQSREWFFDTGDILSPSISADGGFLAIAGFTVTFYELSGPPPAAPRDDDCALTYDDEFTKTYSYAALSPDGSSLAYTLLDNGETADEGDLWILDGLDIPGCGTSADAEDRMVVPGATQPYWSPAAFDPGAGPDPAPVPPSGAVERIDGGGAADPVGQAIATSQALFDDGTADRVVLATSDRFPDALAGSALAGTSGPVLVTPSGPDLDPRVAAEISRVTGGRGIALILGGSAAVSDGAAAEAAAAAGSPSCPPPFPSDCRFAGGGREETAALVGAAVMAEHPGSIVMLARGDDFADAISGGAYAAAAHVPILLTPSGSLNPQTEAFIADRSVQEVIVLGGPSAVSEATMARVPAASRRIAGADRTATAAAVATELWMPANLHGGGVVVVNVRDANGWQTALSGAVASARLGAPQLGVESPPVEPSAATRDAAQALGGPVLVLGDAALVSDGQAAAIATAGGAGG